MTTLIVLSVIPCIALAVLTVILLKPQPAKIRARGEQQHDRMQ